MKKVLFFLFYMCQVNVILASSDLLLLPKPQVVKFQNGTAGFESGKYIWIDAPAGDSTLLVAKEVQKALALAGIDWQITVVKGTNEELIGCTIRIDPLEVTPPQGYRLSIGETGISIVAHDFEGAYYAAKTLKQICAQSHERWLPKMAVNDWPDILNRGVMLDVCRDKVPTMEELYELVELFAGWKINQLQMYTEHTYAFRNHKTVWKDASPVTGEEILELDRYCRERFIELVPNMNSFAHMKRWLGHPEYNHLAENPAKPGTLNPVDPNSIKLLEELYDEMLPHFTSDKFNVGCDETQLGEHRSKAACDEKGVGRVYFEFLLKVYDLCQKHDRKMQFWGDIILNHPEFIPELPKDIITMIWGYEAGYPYDDFCRKFKDAGMTFYVCPGTSSWNTISGRTDNAMGNLLNAAQNGMKHGADGYLITDWGDCGHWQPRLVSFMPYAYGASVAWSVEQNKDVDVRAYADRFIFQDDAKVMSQLLWDLGNVYQTPDVPMYNNSAIVRILIHPNSDITKPPFQKLFEKEKLVDTYEQIEEIVSRLQNVKMQCRDVRMYKDQVVLAANLLKHGCLLGLARLDAKDYKIANIDKSTRLMLAEDLKPLIPEHRRLWLMKHRVGGLKDSAWRMEHLVTLYQQE